MSAKRLSLSNSVAHEAFAAVFLPTHDVNCLEVPGIGLHKYWPYYCEEFFTEETIFDHTQALLLGSYESSSLHGPSRITRIFFTPEFRNLFE